MAAALLGKIGIDALLASGALATVASQVNPEVLKDALNKIGLVANAAGEFVIREGTPIGEAVYNATLQGAEISADLLGSIANGLLSLPGGTTVPEGYKIDPLPTDEYGQQLVDQTSGLGIRTYSPDMSSIPQEAINTESILASLLEAGEGGDDNTVNNQAQIKVEMLPPEDPFWKKLIQGLAKGGRYALDNKKKFLYTGGLTRQAFEDEGFNVVPSIASDSDEGWGVFGDFINTYALSPFAGLQAAAGDLEGGISGLPDNSVTRKLFGTLVNSGKPIETSNDGTDYVKGWYRGADDKLYKAGKEMEVNSQKNKEAVVKTKKVKDESSKVELSKNITKAIDDAILLGIHGNTKLDSLINNVPGVKDYMNDVHGYELK